MSFRFLTRLNWILWSLLALVMVVTMLGLAKWQWDRLHERRELNELVQARMELPVIPLEELVTPGEELDDAGTDELELRQVSATGTYMADDQVLIANRTFEGIAGWWVVTPLLTGDGSAVAVNRGWVPMTVDPNGSWDSFAPPVGEVEVTGVLQPSQTRRAGPMDEPKTLPRLNVEEIDDRLGEVELVPMWVQLLDQQPAQPSGEPAMLPLPPLGDGPHLNYAGQWLIFATLTVVVYVVLVLRTAKRGEQQGRASDDG